MTYVLDANVFIEAARRYYAFDLAPSFWQSLNQYASHGRIQSIGRVKEELERGKDRLGEWVRNGGFDDGFVSTDSDDVIQAYRDVIEWVQRQPQFLDSAKAEFAAGADGWLIAHAKVKGCSIVTQEIPAPDARRRVPIPNVCQAFSVPFVDTFEMLRALGVRFA